MAQDSVDYLLPAASVSTGARASAVCDLDWDGIPDLVTANGTSGSLSALRNPGTGVFTNLSTTSVGPILPIAAASGDANGDGHYDVFLANESNPQLVVLIRSNPGAFASPVGYTAASPARSIMVCDLNNDGILDIGLGSAASVDRFHGNGNGFFVASGTLAVPEGVAALQEYDFDSDGKGDIAIAKASVATLGVFHGLGGGAFGSIQNFPIAFIPKDMALGDVDGDLEADLVFVSQASSQLTLALGDGTGSFSVTQNAPTGAGPRDVLLADLNQDGSLDAIVANSGAATIQVFNGQSTSVFQSPSTFPVSASNSSANNMQSISASDFNGDASIDVASVHLNGFVVFHENAGNGALLQPQRLNVGPSTATLSKPGDLNGDGFPDLALAGAFPTRLSNSMGTATGTFGAPTSTIFPSTALIAGDLADIDQDGILDLLYSGGGSTIEVFRGAGNGSWIASTPIAVGGTPWGIATDDFNADGFIDIACANQTNFSISIVPGSGVGTFASSIHVAAGTQPRSLHTGDLNQDGIPDVACTNTSSNDISILFFTSPGVPGLVNQIGVPGGARSLEIEDLNLDGAFDVVVNNLSTGAFVFLGTGGGGMSGPTGVSTTPGIGMHVADFTEDGIPDLAIAAPGMLQVIPGNGFVFFVTSSRQRFATGGAGLQISVGDFNGDGRIDSAVAGDTSSEFVVFMNQRPAAPFSAAFGSGTPGCAGRAGLALGATAAVGGKLIVGSTGVSRWSLGALLVANASDPTGTDSVGLGISFHVDLFNSTELLAFDALSDGNGVAPFSTGIPNDPALSNQTFYLQGLWVETPYSNCTNAVLNLLSSRGLAFTIQ